MKGSGFGGCDHYDWGYDDGRFYGSRQDELQRTSDVAYSKHLENALRVESVTQKLPKDLEMQIKALVNRPSHYQNDIEFIAPDDVEPRKEIVKDDEEEWESGEETEEDESDFELEDDE